MTVVQNNPDEWGKPDGTMLQSEDDWATPPPDQTEVTLFKVYTAELCRHQIGVHKARQTRMATDIQRYFNSTPARNAFAKLMSLATYDNTLYTKAKVSKELHITRQAAHVMVNECLDAGWIEYGGSCCGNKGYRATERLVEAMENYANRHMEMIEETNIHEAVEALVAYRKMRQAS